MDNRPDHFTGPHLPAPTDGPVEIPPPPPPQTTVLGLVVGAPTTRPSICAVRYQHQLLAPGDPMFGEAPIFETHYNVLGAEYLDAQLSLAGIAQRVNLLAKRLYNRDSRGDYHVLADTSEVGLPIVEAIRFSIVPQVHVTAVTVKPNDRPDTSILWRNDATVGLSYLIARLQAILQQQRLHIPAADPVSQQLLELLSDYEMADSRPPDLVRALALGCASEYMPVRYDASPDLLPSAAM